MFGTDDDRNARDAYYEQEQYSAWLERQREIESRATQRANELREYLREADKARTEQAMENLRGDYTPAERHRVELLERCF
jgi:hypothetical protein